MKIFSLLFLLFVLTTCIVEGHHQKYVKKKVIIVKHKKHGHGHKKHGHHYHHG
ncbi:hypothetical protein CBL_01556 [Carabus blaptoides fortunei]